MDAVLELPMDIEVGDLNRVRSRHEKKEKGEGVSGYVDEYKWKGETLKPLKEVVVEGGKHVTQKVDLTKGIRRNLDYYSATRDLEVDSDRVRQLQGIADQMLEGTGKVARVVIMRKGTEADAFISPDGTVFFSQAALNKLDTLDEVGGVLAHELGHLILETSVRKVRRQMDEGRSIDNDAVIKGIGWVHESASDQLTAQLLEKAGLNSMGFAVAIAKLSGAERGVVHQTGMARSSQSVGNHFVVHYNTSDQEWQKLSDEFRGECIESQKQVALSAVEKLDDAELKMLLPLLHKRDLAEVYVAISREVKFPRGGRYGESKLRKVGRETGERVKSWRGRDNASRTTRMLRGVNEVLLGRMFEFGLSESEGKAYLLLQQDCGEMPPNNYLVTSKDDWVGISGSFDRLAEEIGWLRIEDELFESARGYQIPNYLDTEPVADLVTNFNRNYVVEGVDVEGELDISVDENALVMSLGRLSKHIDLLREKKRKIFTGDLIGYDRFHKEVTGVVWTYLRRAYGLTAGIEGFVNEDGLRNCLVALTRNRVTVDHDVLESLMRTCGTRDNQGKEVISEKNLEVLKSITLEVFARSEQGERNYLLEVDEYFSKVRSADDLSRYGAFVAEMVAAIKESGLSDQERIKIFYRIMGSMRQVNFDRSYDLLTSLGAGKVVTVDSGEKSLEERKRDNDALWRYSCGANLAMSLFSVDGEEFYEVMSEVMKEFQGRIDIHKLSRTQLVTLCSCLMPLGDQYNIKMFQVRTGRTEDRDLIVSSPRGSEKGVSINNHDRFAQLSLIEELAARTEIPRLTTVRGLIDLVDMELVTLTSLHDRSKVRLNMFDEPMFSLVYAGPIVQRFSELLEEGDLTAEPEAVYEFIDRFLPSNVDVQESRHVLGMEVLRSDLTWPEKTSFALRYFDDLGPESLAIIARDLTTMTEYREFRERVKEKLDEYLSGSESLAKLWLSDFASSFVKFGGYLRLLESVSGEKQNQENDTSYLAHQWLDQFMGRRGAVGVEFNREDMTFSVSDTGRRVFRSFRDVVAALHNLSASERFGLVFKSLTERRGAFADDENRKELGRVVVEGLDMNSGFVERAIRVACRKGDPKMITFPISQVVGPLLFRSLDLDSVTMSQIDRFRSTLRSEYGDDISTEDIERILRSSTRDLQVFGGKYKAAGSTEMLARVASRDRVYDQVVHRLKEGGAVTAQQETGSISEKVDPRVEAVFKAVEMTGALGVRQLQLLSQFYRFSDPVVRERAAKALDQNSGLDKLWYFENLLRMVEEDSESEAALVIERAKFGEKLGAGSLYTTYKGELDNLETGEKEKVVFKLQNPNAKVFLASAYELSMTVFSELEKNPRYRKLARIGMFTAELANAWCLKDLDDPYFVEDDARYRKFVSGLGTENGENAYQVPELRLNTQRLKSELQASEGLTLNKAREQGGGGIDMDAQVKTLAKLFMAQFDESVHEVDGEKVWLFHSDPQLGNFIVDSDDTSKQHIIDRNMYLRMTEREVGLLKKMVTEPIGTSLLGDFVDYVLDSNKIRNSATRMSIRASVMVGAGKEFVTQRLKGERDSFAMVNGILSRLSARGCDTRLEMRLMLRNVGMMDSLVGEYGNSLDDFMVAKSR